MRGTPRCPGLGQGPTYPIRLSTSAPFPISTLGTWAFGVSAPLSFFDPAHRFVFPVHIILTPCNAMSCLATPCHAILFPRPYLVFVPDLFLLAALAEIPYHLNHCPSPKAHSPSRLSLHAPKTVKKLFNKLTSFQPHLSLILIIYSQSRLPKTRPATPPPTPRAGYITRPLRRLVLWSCSYRDQAEA